MTNYNSGGRPSSPLKTVVMPLVNERRKGRMNKFEVAYYNETTEELRIITVSGAKTLDDAEQAGKEKKRAGEIILAVNYINPNVRKA